MKPSTHMSWFRQPPQNPTFAPVFLFFLFFINRLEITEQKYPRDRIKQVGITHKARFRVRAILRDIKLIVLLGGALLHRGLSCLYHSKIHHICE